MRSVNHVLTISTVLVSVGVLIVFGALFLSQQKASHYQPEKKLLAPTVPPILMPTPTLAPGQKAIYTFYIQTTDHKTSNEELTLNTSDTGKLLTVDIGTLIIVNFGRVGKFHLSASSPQAIFTNFGRPETIHLPNNALGAFRVHRSGFGTITVIETE